MNKIKKNWIIALSCGVLACGVIGATGLNGVNLKTANANTEAKFEMESGAAVCIAQGKSGIRWTTTINEVYYNSLSIGGNEVEFGVLVTPRNNIASGAELTANTAEVEAIPCESEISFNANGEFTYYSSIIYDNLTAEEAPYAYAVELAARAYVKIGEEYFYVDEYEDCTRSMRSVAYEAFNAGYSEEQVGKYFGDYEISTIASGYYSEMDETATLTNVNNLPNGTYKASVKAQPVEVKVTGATLTVSGALKNLTAGENYRLNVFGDGKDNKNDIYVQNFTYATLVIDEAKDLDYFYLGSDKHCVDTKFDATTDTFSGYYVLAKDIDYTGYTFGASKEEAGTTPQNLQNPAGVGDNVMYNVGLTGVFDGRGYSITNFTPNGAGLFAAINGGTLKNVSISGSGLVKGCGGFLCAIMRNATLENVFVDAGYHSAYGTNGLAKFIINSTLKNCVFKSTTAGSARTWGGMIFAIKDSTFVNCYAITNRPLSADAATVYDAANQKPADDTSATVWIDGIIRYNPDDNATDVPAWEGASAAVLCDGEGNVVGNTLALALDATVELTAKQNGVVCDNPMIEIITNGSNIEVEGSKITVIGAGESTIVVRYAAYGKAYEQEIVVTSAKATETYAKTLTFSAMDGLFFDGAEVVSIEKILGEGVELSSVEHATDTLTVSEGAILGLNTNGTAAVSTQIALDTADKKVLVNVNAYTLVIDEASDMDVFHHGGKGALTSDYQFDESAFTEADDKIDGYYILVKDIDMSKSKWVKEKSFLRSTYLSKGKLQNVGLTGTFDGNGYRLYNFSTLYNGGALFSAINGGTVKNVSVTNDLKRSIQETTYFAGIMYNATIENVYVDVNYDLAESVSMLANSLVNTTFKNCIFVGRTTETTKYGMSRYIQDSTTNFTDCYFISGALIGQKWADGAWRTFDGNNQTAATYTLTGIKRYASVADLEEAEKTNTFASFSTTYWTVVTGKLPVWKTKA